MFQGVALSGHWWDRSLFDWWLVDRPGYRLVGRLFVWMNGQCARWHTCHKMQCPCKLGVCIWICFRYFENHRTFLGSSTDCTAGIIRHLHQECKTECIRVTCSVNALYHNFILRGHGGTTGGNRMTIKEWVSSCVPAECVFACKRP